MPTMQLTEARPVVEATPVANKPGRFLVQLINPGWGSSGYYSSDVLEAAGKAKVFPAGTHMYLDHPTESEEYERPERSVRDLAAVLTEDAYWDGNGLVAETAVFAGWKEALAEMANAIGVSIRASAKVTEGGKAEGRTGRIVNELIAGTSVDFVTHAGRGGKVLEVLESARPVGPAGIAEATMRETEELLSTLIRETYGGEKTWTWLRDFDGTTAWFQVETPDDCATYAQGYTLTDGQVSLQGDRVEVQQHITYVPVTSTGAGTATESEEHVMTTNPEGAAAATEAAPTTTTTAPETTPVVEATTTADGTTVAATTTTTDSAATPAPVTAAETADTTTSTEEQNMTETAGAGGTAPPLGSPRQVLEARLSAQSDQIAQLVAKDRARDIISEAMADAWVSPTTIARLAGELIQNLPIVDHKLDEAALHTRCTEARDRAELEAAETLTAAGVGIPRGLGAMTTPSGEDASKYQAGLKESFQALGLSESAADIAVKGR